MCESVKKKCYKDCMIKFEQKKKYFNQKTTTRQKLLNPSFQ